MVGGVVIEVAWRDDRIFVDCQDRKYPKDTCAIYVERNATSEQIEIGDSLWWQERWAYWTPQAVRDSGVGDSDIKIPRIGYSGVTLNRTRSYPPPSE